MIKLVAFLKRKPGMSREEFFKYWKENHGPLAVKCFPTFKRYVQNHIIAQPGEEPEYDGIMELWFEDIAGYEAVIDFYQSDAGKVIRDDEERFQNLNIRPDFFVEEHIMIP
ncbi:EthD domain-containing protein [Chloroflexota bacterium]